LALESNLCHVFGLLDHLVGSGIPFIAKPTQSWADGQGI
jgi:hypothetical protein